MRAMAYYMPSMNVKSFCHFPLKYAPDYGTQTALWQHRYNSTTFCVYLPRERFVLQP